MSVTLPSRVAAVLAADPAAAAALRRLRDVDPECAVVVDSIFFAARHRARNFAAGLHTADRGGSPDNSRPSHAELPLMTSRQAAEALGLATRSIRDAIHSGRLFAVRHGDRWAIPTAAVAAFAEARAS